MLYTRKGDDGKTGMFHSKNGKRVSKSSCQTESLGALDELNSFLGLVKVKAGDSDISLKDRLLVEWIHWIQDDLFIIQAEVAGADKRISKKKIDEMEKAIEAVEKELPPIRSFLISGGTELTALLDISRTLARKVERVIIGASEKEEILIDQNTLIFLNRLSSLLYAFTRLVNHRRGISEIPPCYN